MIANTQLKTAAMQRRCSMDHHNHLRNFELQSSLPEASDDSAEEDAADALSLGVDDQAIIGVSISRAQSHLASPKTPAAEKAAALFESIDGTLDDAFGMEEEAASARRSDQILDMELPTSDNDTRLPENTALSPLKLPSSSQAGPKAFEVGVGGSATVSSARRISISARKLLPFNFPSIVHNPLSGLLSSTKSSEKDGIFKVPVNEPCHVDSAEATLSNGTRQSAASSKSNPAAIPQETETQPTAMYSETYRDPPILRRSTSDSQFFLERQLSITPTLGDDSRWENVNEQINSRVRAIRDSWHDSNFKMPRIPNIPHLNFGAPWAEFPHTEKQNLKSSGEYSYSEYLDARLVSLPLNGGTLASAKSATPPAGRRLSKVNLATHPEFGKALEDLVGDVIILGGYRGSVLRSAKPPHRQLWVPMKVGLNLRKANLELGLSAEDEVHSEELIIPSGMLKNIGPVDISKRLFKRLRSSSHAREGRLRVWDYGYDWRLSPHVLSQQLVEVLEDLPCNSPDVTGNHRGATVIAHSLGGLITRHAVNSRPDLFAGVIYAGVPQNCVNVLGPLRNGDDVMLSSRVLTAQVNFTIRTTFALLPLDGKCFVDADTKEPYPVDFFDVKSWEEHAFSPCISRPLPPAVPLQPSGFINRAMGTVVSAFPGTSRRNASKSTSSLSRPTPDASSTDISTPSVSQIQGATSGMAPQMGKPNPLELGQNDETNVSTAVTIPKEAAIEYLARILPQVKKFKQDLAFRTENAAKYPPTAVLFGKSLPTVDGCKVRGREGIRRADAYDSLTFASGDGVVLAKAAQIPDGYRVARGGVVSSDRGHISLLGDLEAVGKCLNAILAEQKRRKGRG